MAFITVAQMSAAIAARQGLGSSSSNPSHWDAIAADVVESAYNTIRSEMASRGIISELEAQGKTLADWDRAAEFNRRIGLCHFYREAALRGEQYDGGAIEAVCKCEEDLKTVAVTVSGDLVLPSSSNSRISTGSFDTDDDLHTMEDTL